jgi:hypothetical protein
MKMGVVMQRLTPSMQYRDRADLGTEIARIGGNAAQ